ncbi:alanine--tRNA ligase [Salibacter halophilus]|uniref:Alanine--tRNA ligase n=1 Tax=Salibacter halophilus TaxID=1803916 RepID=A0A6N6M1E3_9FLAO|nr:alanine--tRNA ligase [Salibacter halophilus]KAB1061829.1 alanine--tRNA ligase [Salibacter halophilus]
MQWTSNKIRKAFLDFFNGQNHKIVPSAPLVVKDDPTLMFTNAGMNQFKEFFLGNEKPESTRVTDSQKCLRVSGKHNDLEEVGVDTYHHTMFEMLGNWSFNDYFKEETIDWAWKLLTEVFGIDKDRLYITIFEGDKEDGLPRDTEAFELWNKHVPADRILDYDKADNFWEMGDTGPCGPSSEIHVDIRSDEERKKVDAKKLVNQDHPQVIEIWNLVFIQYNRQASGELKPLPAKHIDTGMGLERLAMVLQEKQSNYDTDLFQNLIQATEKVTGVSYSGSDQKKDIAFRVIVDHIRAISFSIADGQLPSNTGAGYVIRRILRRAVRYGYSFLDQKEAFLYKLLPALIKEMGEAFPELKKQSTLIEKVMKEEEEAFLRTLEKGIQKFSEYRKKHDKVEGEFAFELYDTYGFPIDLTDLLAREEGMKLDLEGFQKALEDQKNRSRKATSMEAGDWVEVNSAESTNFVGYDQTQAEVSIARYREVKQKDKKHYQLVLDQTPFYPEGGGQVGDKGVLKNDSSQISIFDTKKENNLIVHFTKELPKDLNGKFKAEVDVAKRENAARNHTATHLLHHALREILGEHVEQKGSLVRPDYLRFDFSHFQKVTDEELQQIEKRVNELVLENTPLVEKRNIPMDEAMQMGALALFGEKYGDAVRVIKFGDSVELCGGTHVPATGALGLFKLTNETSVAAGIRRVEAITGAEAYRYISERIQQLDIIAEEVKNKKDPVKGVQQVIGQNRELSKQIDSLKQKEEVAERNALLSELKELNGIQFLAKTVDLDAGSIKNLAFKLRKELKNAVILLGSKGKKVTLSLIVTDDVTQSKGIKAGEEIRDLAQHIKGGGGGQPFFATAGGKDANGLDEAYKQIEEKVKSL